MLILVILQFAFSNWQPSAIDSVNSFRINIDDQGFTESFESSMWGSAQAKSFLASFIDSSVVKVPGVFKNPVPYTYHIQKKSIFSFDKSTGERKEILRIKKSPVMIYIPGIFNNSNDSQSRRALNEYKQLGYHTFVLPNPWSEEYINANQNAAKPGDVINEAKSLNATVKEVLKNLDPAMIDGVALAGASYGGFIAGAMSGLDTLNVFSRGTTIIGPPMDFRYSLPFMDSFMDEELERGYNLSLWMLTQIGSDYFFADLAADLTPSSKQNARPFIAKKGFHDAIIATIKAYDKIHRAGWVPRFGNDSEELAWEKTIRFRKYFESYAPETLLLLETEVANLSYWMDLTISEGRIVRLLTTKNDFLNPPIYPTKIDFEMMPPELYLELPNGGHLGFLALKWYESFREAAWAIR
jgi:hypothetical protein